MAEPSQVRQRSGEHVGVAHGLGQGHVPSAATLPRRRPGRSRWVGCIAVIGGVLLFASAAEAAPGKLIASDSDSGSLAWPAVYASFDRPRRLSLTYRITMDPQIPASGEVNVDCSRRRREVERDFPWTSSTSFSAPIKLTLKRADYCSVDIDFYYDEDPDFASARIDLYARQRKKHRP